MKLTCTLVIILSSNYLVYLTNATLHQHKKRALFREYCPENTTAEQCKAFAEKSLDGKGCVSFSMFGNEIVWMTCGVVACAEGTQLADQDLSKPYPECCSRTCTPNNNSKTVYIS